MILYQKDFHEGSFITYSSFPKELEDKAFRIDQVHGKNIVNTNQIDKVIQADGMVTTDKSIMAIKTADCLPILVLGHKGQAMIHAGWRGINLNIMIQEEVTGIEPYYFFIGPHIQSHSFEVSLDFKENFKNSSHFKKNKDNYYFDLSSETKDIIMKHFTHVEVEICSLCTFDNKDFNSYRRDKTSKRNWNLFLPKIDTSNSEDHSSR